MWHEEEEEALCEEGWTSQGVSGPWEQDREPRGHSEQRNSMTWRDPERISRLQSEDLFIPASGDH